MTYDDFVKRESWEVEAAYMQRTGHAPAISDMYHNAWRRLVEGWTHANILHDIRGEPLEPVQPIPGPEPDDPLLGCGAHVQPDFESQLALVRCLYEKLQPRGDVDKVFDANRRIAWALKDRGAGLLKKKEGQSNISFWNGQWYAAAIIAWPDGRLTKTMTDVPNGEPAWNWLDPIDNPKDVYVPAMDPRS